MIVISRMITRLWLTRRVLHARCRRTRTCRRSRPGRAPPRRLRRGRSTRTRPSRARRRGRRISRAGGPRATITRAAPTSSARSRRAGAGSDTVMSSHALRVQHRDDQHPDGARAGDEHTVLGRDARERHRVERDRGGLGERGARASTGSRGSAGADRPAPSCTRRTRPGGPRWLGRLGDCGRLRQTDGRPLRHARHSPHPGPGPAHDAVARAPSRSRSRRPPRSSPPTRARGPSPAAPSARARGAGRCRTCRSARPR